MTKNVPEDWTSELLERAKSIKAKRAKTVIDHILRYGSITSDELQNKYGYRHTSRAIRDVRELGIPIESFRVSSKDGRKISAYKFGSIKDMSHFSLAGRKVFPKAFKEELARSSGLRCNICFQQYEERYLQVDHRVPYEIAGEPKATSLQRNEYMLLCGSCNRSKSWSCEHCPNWTKKSIAICKACYWASPEKYQHIATENIRRLALMWKGSSTHNYDVLLTLAAKRGISAQDYLKNILGEYVKAQALRNKGSD
jgi:5-methylcytosine-specific restriction endonuclease McrA